MLRTGAVWGASVALFGFSYSTLEQSLHVYTGQYATWHSACVGSVGGFRKFFRLVFSVT